jgi:glycerophosphoryl diester phosphodiesterase
MWNEIPSPIIIAHRGDKAFSPENTLSAFKQAASKGADAIEFDVKLTADGTVIILHDQTVDRTTNGTGNISKIPFSALRELDAGVQFPGKFVGERVPTLEEVFETVGKTLFMNIELTNYSTPNDALVEKVVDLVKKHRMQGRVFFSSFFTRNLNKARQLLPKVPGGLLTLPGYLGWWGRTFGWRGGYKALNPFITDTTARLVERVHAAAKQIIVWTVNMEKDINRMISLAVDGIITDDPGFVIHLSGRGK